MAFNKVNPKQSFPKLEEEILKFWQENKIFEESISNREGQEEFCFFDGPPFATGTPHYGHILAGVIKDVIPRYQTMRGKKVERRFGWDTHGLPIENIVEKKLQISGKEQIEEVGIFKFNEICRENVLTYVNEWRKVVERMGRWVDMDNDYKTMNTDFMESVWWVFKTIYDKGLIYEGNRVVPYCPRCSTPLANFEVNQGYKDKQDKSITVKFKILPDGIEWENKEKQDLNKYFLAWTTTPWTLMSNLGLAVGEDVEYSEIKDLKNGEIYILATARLNDYYKNEEEYELLATYKGTRLEGMRYEPIYPDFYEQLGPSLTSPYQREEQDQNPPNLLYQGEIENSPLDKGRGSKYSSTNQGGIETSPLDKGGQRGVYRKSNDLYLGENAYSVVLGHHIDTSTGTGIVHIAPAYGEDDFIIGKKFDLGFVQHIDGVGKVVNTLKDNGKYVFNYNEDVISELKGKGVIVKIATIDHSYPHCRRCNTPLIYRGISAWYVAVEKFRDKMVANNEKITWVPETIKYGRFGNWLKEAKDWNISRNRYWGSAIPVWQSEDKKEEVCIGSIEELYELNKEFKQIEKRPIPLLSKEGGMSYKYFYTKYDVEIDLHKHYVDEILLKNPKTGNTLKRIPEVLDCWFESGSMPYASKHYPFELERMSEDISEECQKMGGIERISNDEKLNEKTGKIIGIAMKIHNELGTGLEEKVYHKTLKIALEKAGFEVKSEVKNSILFEGNEVGYGKIDLLVDDEIVIELKSHRKTKPDYYKQIRKYLNQSDYKAGLLINFYNLKLEFNRFNKDFKYKSSDNLLKKSSDILSFKPADFIAEGLDQTRGWFYTLLILSTALFDNTSFENVIVNGIVLAEDGKKMSKSLQNYPAPELIFDKYGADAMRFYLMNSPVVEAQDFRFVENGVDEIVRKVILPLWNTYYFFVTYANIDGFEGGISENYSKNIREGNKLDLWLVSELNELIKEVSEGFDSYKLDVAAKPIIKFMDNLTNWYIRRSRKRFWKSENDSDKQKAYETLYFVLIELTKIIAPLMPFISEYIFKELTNKKSVHLEDFPVYNPNLIDEKLNEDTEKVQKIITLGLAWRANNKIRVRQPLNSITITEKLEEYYKDIIKEELNIKEVLVVSGDKLAKKICKPNGRNIGPKFGKDVKFIMEQAKAGNFEELGNGNVRIERMSEDKNQKITEDRKEYFELETGDFEIEYLAEDKNAKIEAGFGMVIAMDDTITEGLKLEGYARDLVRHIQEARKEAGYEVDDRISVEMSEDKSEESQKIEVKEVLGKFRKYIENETLSKIVDNLENVDLEKDVEVEELRVKIRLKK